MGRIACAYLRVLAVCALLGGVGGAAASDSCVSVNYRCESEAAPAFSQAGRATVLLRFPGALQCSGVLVNNVRGDGRPFLLTSRHCAWGSAADLGALAASVEIHYGYEVGCDGTRVQRWIAYGAHHRAAFADAWLLEAHAPPALAADAYLAGIELRGPDSGDHFGVHHGDAAAKRFVAQRVVGSALLRLVRGTDALTLQSWHTNLLRGSTPPGSSGSGLFDALARVNGLLSSGDSCSESFAGNYYQKLTEVWDGGGSADTSLRYWLDADDLGVVSIDGVDANTVSTAEPKRPAVIIGQVQARNGGAIGLRLLLPGAVAVLLRRLRGRRTALFGGTGLAARVHLGVRRRAS